MTRPVSSVLSAVGRALPRVLGAVLGCVLAGSDGETLGIVGVAILVLSVMTNPVEWWRYVRTGTPSERPVPAQLSEPGACSVELQSPGKRQIDVIKALREVTGAGLAEAKSTVQAAPVVVARCLSTESAERVRDRLERTGATAVVLRNSDTH